MSVLTNAENDEKELNEQRRNTYRVLSQLYQAEIIGQSVSAGQIDDFYRYRKALRNSKQTLDELYEILNDSVQKCRLDTIALLLRQKEYNMYNLLKAMKETNTGHIYQQKIERIIQEQDTTIIQEQQKIQKKVVVNEQSYVTKKKRPGFFKRLAQVFVPPKEDSTLVTNTKSEFVTDTLVNSYNPADSVATILRTIQMQVSDSISHMQNNIQVRIDRFKQTGRDLSSQMNEILQTFEKKEQSIINQKLQLGQNARAKSIRAIAIVAIVAIILVALFLFFIERDISRSNHYRQELEKAKHRAEDLLVAREKLMLTITHDIKAPAGSIIGYIDLLTRLLKNERQQFYLQNMKASARHLIDLVSSLLDFHKLESNKMDMNAVPFNPPELFYTIYTSFKPLAEKKNLKIYYQTDDKLDRFYLGDPFRIRQIADNLLSNALKFTQEGSIKLGIKLDDGKFQFSVTDTGSGISKAEQKKMFNEFTRLQNAQGEEGFGLGLAITQRLINLMNGNIEVISEPGKGSTFIVNIPLHLASGEVLKHLPDKKDEKKESTSCYHERKIRLIFIDDDRIQLDLTKAMLQHPLLDVSCYNTPDILFQQIKKESYDILFTDIQMPALNGFELLKALRTQLSTQARTIPVIALTARSDMSEEQFISQGFSGCLHKPFSRNEVLNIIKDVLNRNISDISFEMPQDNILTRKDGSSFNFAALTAFSEDDPEASTEIIKSFINETLKNKELLEKALKENDWKQVKAIAHKQLPLFTMLEANECIPLLTWLERENYTDLTDSIVDKINFVLQQMEKIISEAQKRC